MGQLHSTNLSLERVKLLQTHKLHPLGEAEPRRSHVYFTGAREQVLHLLHSTSRVVNLPTSTITTSQIESFSSPLDRISPWQENRARPRSTSASNCSSRRRLSGAETRRRRRFPTAQTGEELLHAILHQGTVLCPDATVLQQQFATAALVIGLQELAAGSYCYSAMCFPAPLNFCSIFVLFPLLVNAMSTRWVSSVLLIY